MRAPGADLWRGRWPVEGRPVAVSGADSRWRALAAALVAVAALAGLGLRLLALGRAPINADEAVVGLMAREILHGRTFAFYWGQAYGGAEPYAVAAVFALFGSSPFTLGLTPVLLDGLAALLAWRVARRLVGPRAGALAAIAFWIWPEVDLVNSTLEYGFRWACLVCGLGLWLLALRMEGKPAGAPARPARSWLLLGLVGGLGWWCSPEIAYFAVPAAALLGRSLARRHLRLRPGDAVALAAGAAVGALPWIWAVVARPNGLERAAETRAPAGYLARLGVVFTHVLPMALGLRLPTDGTWLLPAALGGAVAACALAGCAGWAVRAWRRPGGALVATFLIVFPFAYAASPRATFWEDGRYGLYVAPVLAVSLVGAAGAGGAILAERWPVHGGSPGPLRRWSLRAGPVGLLLVGLAVSTAVAAARSAPFTSIAASGVARSRPWAWQSDPTGRLAAVADRLAAAGVRRAYAGYWVAYVLTFEARGRLLAAPVAPGFERYRPLQAAVADAPAPGWLLVPPGRAAAAEALLGTSVLDPPCVVPARRCLTPASVAASLRRARIGYRTVVVPPFEAIVPSRRLGPAALLARRMVRRRSGSRRGTIRGPRSRPS